MKKVNLLFSAFLLIGMMLSTQMMAQGRIDLGIAKSAQECFDATEKGFSATFSFSSIDASEVMTEKGVFSNIVMDGTYPSGNIGDPTLPAANKLIAVPFGASNVSVEVKSYSTEVYKLSDFGIHSLNPMQTPLRKDQDPKDVPFEYNAKAYTTAGFVESPIAMFKIKGTMRGIQVGALTINPVQYDAVNNLVRVFNNIEVEVNFGEYDKVAAYDEFARTFNPYFVGIYKTMFNNRQLRDVYEDHPDLWQNPVKMLVIANRAFESTIQDWVNWKTEKGFYVDVNYTDEIGSNAAAIKTFIQQKYAEDAPTFLMIMGDRNMVPESANGSETNCVTDLQYSSVDGDMFSDMFHSRFPAENEAHMIAMLNKALEYEQYTMPDPSYLNNVLLIAGEDSSGWGVEVGRPAIWYASNYYYNEEHGFANVYEYSHGTYTGCYNNLSTGVGFANYTAHGSQTSWAGPSFTVSDVNNLTNEHKYFLAMGNCCQAADWGYSSTCFGEAMVRAENKGAYAYIGSCPSTYWLNDYYFAVGATSQHNGQMPDISITTMGCYDAIWDDEAYNTVDAIRFIGNLASNAAEELGYTIHISNLYDWQAYHTLGDGSVLPFRVQPTDNDVTHLPTVPIGVDFYTVSAAPGSYVGITMDGVLYGAGMVDETGTTDIPMEPILSGGTAKIVVTHPQHVPYIAEIPAASLEGPYIAIDDAAPIFAHVGDETPLSIVFKNVGSDPTTGTTNIELACASDDLVILNGIGSFEALDPDAYAEVDGFSYQVADGVADGTKFTINVISTNGDEVWEGKVVITAGEAVLEYVSMASPGGFTPGETVSLASGFINNGHYMATNALITISCDNPYVTIEENSVDAGTIDPEGTGIAVFNIAIDPSCPITEQIVFNFTVEADGGLTAEGTGVLKNACNVIFDLADSYGDGWNGASLNVAFSDGTPSQSLNIPSGGSSATYVIEIANGVHVSLTWTSGSWDSECSFTVSYEDGGVICQASSLNSSWTFDFDCDCPSATSPSNLPVEDLTYDVTGYTINLSWTAPANATGYVIIRNGIVIDETTATNYADEIPYEIDLTYCVIALYDEGDAMPACIVIRDALAVSEDNGIAVYPNPTNNVLYINGNSEYSYVLYNGMGQQVTFGTAQGLKEIDVKGLAKGIYFLRLTNGSQVDIQKIVID